MEAVVAILRLYAYGLKTVSKPKGRDEWRIILELLRLITTATAKEREDIIKSWTR